VASGINFYSKMDYILEFLRKKNSVCDAFETSVSTSASLAGDVTSACLFFPGFSWSKACNGNDRASCM